MAMHCFIHQPSDSTSDLYKVDWCIHPSQYIPEHNVVHVEPPCVATSEKEDFIKMCKSIVVLLQNPMYPADKPRC